MTLDALSMLEIGQVLKPPADAGAGAPAPAISSFQVHAWQNGIIGVKVGDPVNQKRISSMSLLLANVSFPH